MTDRESLVEKMMAAIARDVTGLHPSIADRVARVAARVAVENIALVAVTEWEDLVSVEEPLPRSHPTLCVVEDHNAS